MSSEVVPEIRLTKKRAIRLFFQQNIEKEYSSYALHALFGSAFRSRVSEINREDKEMAILNRVDQGATEPSYYRAVRV